MLSCNYCDLKLTKRSAYVNHVKSAHLVLEKRSIKCKECGVGIVTTLKMVNHLMNSHPDRDDLIKEAEREYRKEKDEITERGKLLGRFESGEDLPKPIQSSAISVNPSQKKLVGNVERLGVTAESKPRDNVLDLHGRCPVHGFVSNSPHILRWHLNEEHGGLAGAQKEAEEIRLRKDWEDKNASVKLSKPVKFSGQSAPDMTQEEMEMLEQGRLSDFHNSFMSRRKQVDNSDEIAWAPSFDSSLETDLEKEEEKLDENQEDSEELAEDSSEDNSLGSLILDARVPPDNEEKFNQHMSSILMKGFRPDDEGHCYDETDAPDWLFDLSIHQALVNKPSRLSVAAMFYKIGLRQFEKVYENLSWLNLGDKAWKLAVIGEVGAPEMANSRDWVFDSTMTMMSEFVKGKPFEVSLHQQGFFEKSICNSLILRHFLRFIEVDQCFPCSVSWPNEHVTKVFFYLLELSEVSKANFLNLLTVFMKWVMEFESKVQGQLFKTGLMRVSVTKTLKFVSKKPP